MRAQRWALLATVAVVVHTIYTYHGSISVHDALNTPAPRRWLAPPPPLPAASPRASEASAAPIAAPSELPREAPPPPAPPSLAAETPPSLAAFELAARQLWPACETLVATAVFEGAHLLRQPKYCEKRKAQAAYRRAQRTPSERDARVCHVAFVDWQSERMLKQTLSSDLAREHDEAFIGCWQLLRVAAGPPYTHGEANALLPKLMLPALFRSANASVWVDASRQLLSADVSSLAKAVHAMGEGAMLAIGPPSPAGAGRSGVGEEGAGTSVVVRRHRPADGALQLAGAWLARWERLERSSSERRSAAERRSEKPAPLHALLTSTAAHAELSAERAWASMLSAAPAGLKVSKPAPALEALGGCEREADAWPIAPLSRRREHVGASRPPAAKAVPAVVYARPKKGAGAKGFASGRGGDGAGAGVSDAERKGALSLAPAALDGLSCGFMRGSAFDAAREVGSASRCELVTLTSVFEAYDELIQPTDDALKRMGADEKGCFYALVDRRSYDLLLHEARERLPPASAGADGLQRAGVWKLVLLEGKMPFTSSRRNSRVPKMLPHRIFANARYCVWIDSKLKLHQPPSVLRKRFLPTKAAAVFAAYRNLRRDHIDEERDWIWKHKCAEDVHKCELIDQWAAYEAEQPSPTWTLQTVAIEGSVLLQDLAAPLHNAIFCNWFNEYGRYGERDQISISYVLHRMGLTANGTNSTGSLRLIERDYHYLTKPSKRPLTLVTKQGHRSGSRRIPRS